MLPSYHLFRAVLLDAFGETVDRILLARSLVQVQLCVLRKYQFLIVVLLGRSFKDPVVNRGSQRIGVVDKEIFIMDKYIVCKLSKQKKFHAGILIQSGEFWRLESEIFSK